jgi:alpha/beta hydrolase family protein DUF900
VTYFVSFRSQSVGGSVIDGGVFSGNGAANPLALTAINLSQIQFLVAGKNILFATHGFNVSREAGACSLTRLDTYLNLDSSNVFFGVLWPGDFWLPVVNYPFEGDVSMDCGRRLATFCNRYLTNAQSLSFISHSLGARLVLEAVKNLKRQARSVCLTAAAINQDCLATEYAAAAQNAAAISILASHKDMVLKLAFPIGDPIADLLHSDHTLFERALGYAGPPVPASLPVKFPWQIPDSAGYDHGDYLPSGNPGAPVPIPAIWNQPADFMARAFRGQTQSWPP